MPRFCQLTRDRPGYSYLLQSRGMKNEDDGHFTPLAAVAGSAARLVSMGLTIDQWKNVPRGLRCEVQ